ncbi:MAG: MFS transporter [Bacillota bacterium]|nr:MFS transporter [Bacillota bacterium]
MERWKINLYTLWVTQVFSLMGFGLCIPFTPFYLQALGMSDPDQLSFFVGLTYTLPAATMAVAAPIWGLLSDRYGRKPMILRAMGCATVLLSLMGLANAVWQFAVLRAMQGIFTGTVTASMSFVSAYTPTEKQSYALGLMTSSNFLGYSIGPFIGGFAAEYLGYRACFYIGAAIMAAGCLLVLFLVKEDKSVFTHRLPEPKEKKKGGMKIFTPFIVAVLVALLFQRIARTIFAPYLALFVQESLGTISGAASATGVINGAVGLATAAAALTLARWGDKKERMRLTILLTVLSLPVTVLLPFSPSLLFFGLAYTAYFLLAGAVEPVLTAAAATEVPVESRGALFGFLATVSSVGAMLSPMLGAWLSVRFSLMALLIVIPVLTAVQLLCLFPARKKTGEKTNKEAGEPRQDV